MREKQEGLKREFKEQGKLMETDENASNSEKVYNSGIRENGKANLVKMKVINCEKENTNEKERKRKQRKKLISDINTKKEKERCYQVVSEKERGKVVGIWR